MCKRSETKKKMLNLIKYLVSADCKHQLLQCLKYISIKLNAKHSKLLPIQHKFAVQINKVFHNCNVLKHSMRQYDFQTENVKWILAIVSLFNLVIVTFSFEKNGHIFHQWVFVWIYYYMLAYFFRLSKQMSCILKRNRYYRLNFY